MKRQEASNEKFHASDHQFRHTFSLYILLHLPQVSFRYLFPVRKKRVKVRWQIHPCCCGCERTALPLWLLWQSNREARAGALSTLQGLGAMLSLCWVCQGFARLNVLSLEDLSELSVNKGEQGLERVLCGRELCGHQLAWFSHCSLGVGVFSVFGLGLELVFK